MAPLLDLFILEVFAVLELQQCAAPFPSLKTRVLV